MDPQTSGPPFGDGPWEDDEATVRATLNAVVIATVKKDGDAEMEAWTKTVNGLPAWQWVGPWIMRRIAVCMARQAGYLHEGPDVLGYVEKFVDNYGPYRELVSPDGLQVLYQYESGKWLAFECTSPIQLPFVNPYGSDGEQTCLQQPFAWRQLHDKPDGPFVDREAEAEENAKVDPYRTPLIDKIEIECDKHKGASLAECGCPTDAEKAAQRGDYEIAETLKRADEVFGRPIKLARNIDPAVCVRCDRRIEEGCGVETPAKTWAHLDCWKEMQVEAESAPAPDMRRKGDPARSGLPETRLDSLPSVPLSEDQEPGGPVFYDSGGPEPSNGWTNTPVESGDRRVGMRVETYAASALMQELPPLGRYVDNSPEATRARNVLPDGYTGPKATGTMAGGGRLKDAPAPEWELDEEDDDVDQAEPAGADVLPDLVLMAKCTECPRTVRMMARNWPGLYGTDCPDCKKPIMVWEAGVGEPKKTADMLEGRPKLGQWRCDGCDEPAYSHVSYRDDGPLSCGDCPGFVPPVSAQGSLCQDCHHVHSWVLGDGVINSCDACSAEGTLVNYDGRHQLEQLKAKERRAKKAETALPLDPDKPICEACETETAAVRFTRAGKNHPVLYACRRCADKTEVRGRRTAFSEVA